MASNEASASRSPPCVDIEMVSAGPTGQFVLPRLSSETQPTHESDLSSSHGAPFEGFDVASSLAGTIYHHSPQLEFPFFEDLDEQEESGVSTFEDLHGEETTELSVVEDSDEQEPSNWWCLWILVIIVVVGAVISGVMMILFLHSREGQQNVELRPMCPISITVSKDGSSNFTTISKAVDWCPSLSLSKICIFIRAGKYHETVSISDEKINLMLIGEGVDRTIITSNASVFVHHDNIWPQAATLTILGKYFLLQDLTVVNTNQYGFAVENLGDHSVFHRSNLEGYNTTLYMNGQSQFYRNCTFRGKSSLVFGFGKTFFQKCEFYCVKAYPEERVVFFSQSSPFIDVSKFIFHLCSFHVVQKSPNSSPTASLVGYFGPLASTIAVLQSSLDNSIDSYYFQGSLPSNATSYIVFGNTRQESPIKEVPTYIRSLSSVEAASKYSLRRFLGRQNWIPAGVDYDLDLTN